MEKKKKQYEPKVFYTPTPEERLAQIEYFMKNDVDESGTLAAAPDDLLKYPTVGSAIPRLIINNFTGRDGVGGYMYPNDPTDSIYVNRMNSRKRTSNPQMDTVLHEAEHILAKKGLGSPEKINQRFDELAEGPKVAGYSKGMTRDQVVSDLVRMAPYLEGKYGVESAYFDKKIHSRNRGTLLYEQLATLGALEAKYPELDLTTDPILRKEVFNTKAKREAFRALVGLRQTRLDSKDLPPHTRIPEKEEVGQSILDQLLYKIKGGR